MMANHLSTTNNEAPWPASWEPAPALEAAAEPAEPARPARPARPGAGAPPGLGPPPFGPPTGPSLGSPFGPPPGDNGEVARWLDEQERDLVHPQVVEEELRRSGWHPMQAAMQAGRYRSRFNEHSLGYSALLIATGVAALATGTAGHLLAAGIDRHVNRNALAFSLTLLVVSLPFAVWAHIWAARVDHDDPVAVWSASRRLLALALVWACGVVGVGRLMIYAGGLIGSLVGATWARGSSTLAGAVNVGITVSIALPLGLWAFHFLHRFDAEDPTRPGRRHRSTSR